MSPWTCCKQKKRKGYAGRHGLWEAIDRPMASWLLHTELLMHNVHAQGPGQADSARVPAGGPWGSHHDGLPHAAHGSLQAAGRPPHAVLWPMPSSESCLFAFNHTTVTDCCVHCVQDHALLLVLTTERVELSNVCVLS